VAANNIRSGNHSQQQNHLLENIRRRNIMNTQANNPNPSSHIVIEELGGDITAGTAQQIVVLSQDIREMFGRMLEQPDKRLTKNDFARTFFMRDAILRTTRTLDFDTDPNCQALIMMDWLLEDLRTWGADGFSGDGHLERRLREFEHAFPEVGVQKWLSTGLDREAAEAAASLERLAL
jgi:hypothetical protein